MDLLRADEMDIALRLSHLMHSGGDELEMDKEARRKEKKKQKDLKVRCRPFVLVQVSYPFHTM